MGQTNCSLCSCDNKENELHLELTEADSLKASTRGLKSAGLLSSQARLNFLSPQSKRKQDLFKRCTQHLTQVVKIQAVWRGYQDRKLCQHLCKMQRESGRYFTQAERLESGNVSFALNEREVRPAYTFQNGAVYVGEWRGSAREGHGEQTWPDDAKYVGEWRENKVWAGSAPMLSIH